MVYHIPMNDTEFIKAEAIRAYKLAVSIGIECGASDGMVFETYRAILRDVVKMTKYNDEDMNADIQEYKEISYKAQQAAYEITDKNEGWECDSDRIAYMNNIYSDLMTHLRWKYSKSSTAKC